jgi:phosphatidyl-myo-inositol alpha-mannosyltransferase
VVRVPTRLAGCAARAGSVSLKILQVCPYDLYARGGVQTHIAQLSRALEAQGHQLHLVAPSHSRTAASNVQIVGCPTAVPFNKSVAPTCLDPRAVLLVRRAIKRFEPDLVHVHEPFSSLVPLIATLSASVPVVATFHAAIDQPIERWVYQRWATLLIVVRRRLDRCIAVSSVAAATARLVIDHAVDVVPNGTDFSRREEEAVVHGRPDRTLLFVSRLDRRKGFHVALEAFRILRRSGQGLRLVVVGEGPERVWVDRLERDVRVHVKMMGDCSSGRLREFYEQADVLLAPATGCESFGIVVLDALAAGLPVVASNIPAYRDLLEQGDSGVLVPPGDAQALADGIARVLQDHDLWRILSQAGIARGSAFAWHHVASRVEAIYRETLRVRGCPVAAVGEV